MNRIKKLPELNWSQTAKDQLAMTGEELVLESTLAFQLREAACVGLIYHSLTAPPWLWFLLAEGVSFGDLIDMRRKQELIPRGTMTAVDAGDNVALRFANFYGFRETGQSADYGGYKYLIMEKV